MLKADIQTEDEVSNNPDFNEQSELTDFALILGGEWMATVQKSTFFNKLKNYGLYFTKTQFFEKDDVVTAFDHRSYYARRFYSPYVSVKPVISYDTISTDGLLVSFGKWPQNTVYGNLADAIFHYAVMNRVEWTNNKYPILQDGSFILLPSFIYKKREFVIVKALENTSSNRLSNCLTYESGNYIVIEVSPIIWYNDKKNKKLISKKLLFAGVPLSLKEKYDGNPDFMIDFLNKAFLPAIRQEITLLSGRPDEIKSGSIDELERIFNPQNNSYTSNLNEKNQEIDKILSEIYTLLKTYYGEEDIEAVVDSLIAKYNDNLSAIFKNKQNSFGLSLDNYKDENTLYLYLISDLEDIVKKLKQNNERYKEYFDILNFINICLDNIIENNNSHDITFKQELKDDICVIWGKILLFLDDRSLDDEFKELLTSEKNKILSYVKGHDIEIEYHNFNEFELFFRKQLVPYLLKLNKLVRDKDLVKEIQEFYANMQIGKYTESKNNYLNYLFKQITNLITEIEVNGNYADREKMKAIQSMNLNLEQDVFDILRDIDKIYKKLYLIILDINERIKLEEQYGNFVISVNKDKYKRL